MNWILELFKLVPNAVDAYTKRKQAKLESELRVNEAVTNAKIEAAKAGQISDTEWENLQVANSGWKDEWFVVVLSIPLIMCFIPGLEGYVMQGFNVLAGTPEWYQYALLLAISASFGYRKLADFMDRKKQNAQD